jgi:hypothetical protein
MNSSNSNSSNINVKPSKSILDDENSSSSFFNNKPKYFIPWKRAELNPSIVKKGTEVHINPLPLDCSHEELYNLLNKYGEIIDLRIIPRKDKGNCFAFVRFADKNSVDFLIKEKFIKHRVSSI